MFHTQITELVKIRWVLTLVLAKPVSVEMELCWAAWSETTPELDVMVSICLGGGTYLSLNVLVINVQVFVT